MTDNQKMADLLFPNITKSPDYYLNKYKARNLPEGVEVTRFAPSPTGFLHIGGLRTCLIDYILSKSTKGICFLRIEDTDKKREVEGTANLLISTFSRFGIDFDECPMVDGGDKGEYGPYVQSRRTEIYQCFAKDLVAKGLAYPCFCTEEEEAERDEKQKQMGCDYFGYYGEFAKCANRPLSEVEQFVSEGRPFAIRLRVNVQPGDRIKYFDVMKGERETNNNINNPVILKRDGTPPYNFAHAIDDHLMGTTSVIRGEDWLSSLPEHLQIFDALGFEHVKYVHVSQVDKQDGDSRRKLSKRKDPEANVEYFFENGYPSDSVVEYLLTILNADFEPWRKENPYVDWREYPFKLNKMSTSGTLFDLVKVNDVSKNLISRYTAKEVLDSVLAWAKDYDSEVYEVIGKDKAYSEKVFAIERGGEKPRKDIYKWSDIKTTYAYMFNDFFKIDYSEYDFNYDLGKDTIINVLNVYKDNINFDDDKQQWFARMKECCSLVGFCPDMKEYKKNPTEYKGSVADFSAIIRVCLTSRRNSLDLHEIIQTLGSEEVLKRINNVIEYLSK